MPPHPPALHHYLRRATRGLWGRRRREVWEELEAHILERSRAFGLSGQSEEQSIRQVLAELGEPSVVSRGMVRLHTLPVVLPMLVFLLISGFVLTTQNATVQVVRDGPSPICIQVCEVDADWAWTGIAGFKRVLEAQGVRWEGNTLTFPGDQPIELNQAYDRAVWKLKRPVFIREGETYWITQALVEAIANRSWLPVRLSGWGEPVLEIGQVKVQLAQGEVWVRKLYRNLLAQRIAKFNPDADIAGYPTYGYRFKVEAELGTVYAVLASSVRGYFRSQFAAVEDGQVEFNLPWKQVGFAGLDGLSFSEPGQSATIALLKLTGRLDKKAALYEVVGSGGFGPSQGR